MHLCVYRHLHSHHLDRNDDDNDNDDDIDILRPDALDLQHYLKKEKHLSDDQCRTSSEEACCAQQ
jgi:hypothetical protein